jgi:hypothetical protein
MKFILILLITTSCSFKSFIVSNIDYIITDKISDRFDLTSDQEDYLKKDIKKLLNEIKVPAKEIQTAISKIEFKNSIQTEVLKNNYLEIINKFIPILSKYYLKLTKEQKTHLFKIEREKNKELLDQLGKITALSITDKTEDFIGDINEKQKRIITEEISLMIDLSKRRLDRRLKIQKELERANTLEQINKAFELYTFSIKNNIDLESKFMIFINKMIKESNQDQKEVLKKKQRDIIQIIDYFLKIRYE